MNSTARLIARPKEFNSHIEHLKGKNLDELNKMFPDAKMEEHECEFSDLDHGITMEYKQREIDMQKRGIIRIMYRVGRTGNMKLDWNSDTNKIFEWYNGKKWIVLTQ